MNDGARKQQTGEYPRSIDKKGVKAIIELSHSLRQKVRKKNTGERALVACAGHVRGGRKTCCLGVGHGS